MAGFVPAIHVFLADLLRRRGCPRQARAWRRERSDRLREFRASSGFHI